MVAAAQSPARVPNGTARNSAETVGGHREGLICRFRRAVSLKPGEVIRLRERLWRIDQVDDVTHDDPIRPHAKRVPHKVAHGHLALALDVGGTRYCSEARKKKSYRRRRRIQAS